MFDHEEERKDYDPVYETYLNTTYSGVIFCVHNFLELCVAFLDLYTGLFDMKINSVKQCTLFNDQVADITEKLTQIVHLSDNVVNFLFFELCNSRICVFDLFNNF